MNTLQIMTWYRDVCDPSGNGLLYNWYAASNANFAPANWRVPIVSDYDTLISGLGGESVAGGKVKVVDSCRWLEPNTGATNSSGLTIFGSGTRGQSGLFSRIFLDTDLWTQEEFQSEGRKYWLRNYSSSFIGGNYGTGDKKQGLSMRLIYTGTGSPTTVTDYDGNIYDVIQIGTQYWIKQNWKCTHLNDGTSIPNVTDNTAWSNLTTLARCAYDNDESNV